MCIFWFYKMHFSTFKQRWVSAEWAHFPDSIVFQTCFPMRFLFSFTLFHNRNLFKYSFLPFFIIISQRMHGLIKILKTFNKFYGVAFTSTSPIGSFFLSISFGEKKNRRFWKQNQRYQFWINFKIILKLKKKHIIRARAHTRIKSRAMRTPSSS